MKTNPALFISLTRNAFLFTPLALAWCLVVSSLAPAAWGQSFSSTGSMLTGRVYHTATLLPNGKVLVAGGDNGTGILDEAELYDPSSGTWSTTGSLFNPRTAHTATLLGNGKVLAAGGQTPGTYIAAAELYDPASGLWSGTGILVSESRVYHTATLLPNGKVLVAGGENSIGNLLASAELYDPSSGTWSATGSLATTREYHTATLLPNGKVLVAGGSNNTNGVLASAELYDPASGAWMATGSLATARAYHTATLLPNGKVLVAGGSGDTSAELYDPSSGTWSATGSLVDVLAYGHTATLLADGNVLVAGGADESGTTSAELYDVNAGTWSATGSLVTSRALHTATLLPNGKVLLAGGGGVGDRSAELYNPGTVQSLSITPSTASLVQNAPEIIISGTGFSPTLANNNVTFDDGAVGTVTNATATQLTVTFTTQPTAQGVLHATVAVTGAGTTGPTQVATVVGAPSYTFGPPVLSGTPSMTYNSGTDTFQYTDTANSTDDSAYVPLTGTAAALITTATGWTTTLTVNLSARSMTAVGTSVDPSDRISIGVGTSNLQNFAGLTLIQADYTGSVNSEVPNYFYGTAVEFGARTNGVAAAPTPLGTSQLGIKNGVTNDCYQVLSGGTSSTPATESISAANGILTLIYTATSNTVTGYYNGAPVGSFSLAGWGSNPALTLFVLGASGEGVAVPAGTATATAFYVAGPVAISPNPANLAENASQITIAGTGFDPIAGNNTVTFSDGAVGTVTAATTTSLTVSFTTDPTGLGNLTAVVTTDGHSSGAAVLVATITPPVYVIAASASPSADGTASGGGSFNSGAGVTVTATPNAGYRFVNWTVSGTVVSTTANYTFTASANESLVANFSTGVPAMPNWGWVVLSGMLLFLAGRHLPARGKCSS